MNTHKTHRKVTAVVVTYQSARTLEATLAATRRGYDSQVLDCVFVDNGSTDNTPEILLGEANWAKVILTGENNGFGRGCNIGLAQVASPYTLFLNPDAQVEPDAIRGMIDFLDANPGVGIVGPATYCGSADEPPIYQGTSELLTPWHALRAAIPLLPSPKDIRPIVPGSPPFRTGWVCGAVLMIRTELAIRLAGFDPRFFLYFEEMDLCHRATELGFETWAIGRVTANHIGGASSANDETRVSGCIGRHYYQSRRYYMIKHHGWYAATVAELGEFGLLCVRTFADILRGNGISRLRPRLQAPLFSQPKKA